jgi:hypothetical protein
MSAYQTEESRIKGIYARPWLKGDIAIDQLVLKAVDGRAAAVMVMARALDMMDLVEGCDTFEDLETAEFLLVAAAKKAAADALGG